jgi:hypothetical protein
MHLLSSFVLSVSSSFPTRQPRRKTSTSVQGPSHRAEHISITEYTFLKWLLATLVMDDDFYEPLSSATSIAQSLGPISIIWSYILSSPLIFIGTVLLALPLLFIAIRPNGNTSEEPGGGQKRTVWMVPYWLPIVGHSLQ